MHACMGACLSVPTSCMGACLSVPTSAPIQGTCMPLNSVGGTHACIDPQVSFNGQSHTQESIARGTIVPYMNWMSCHMPWMHEGRLVKTMSRTVAVCMIIGSAFAVGEARAKSFVWGTASASWQYEGATKADGRGPSIWDDYCTSPNPTGSSRCWHNQTADIAVDQYNYTFLAQDIQRMQQLGTTAYRLSIAWSRVMPSGQLPVNPLFVLSGRHTARRLCLWI